VRVCQFRHYREAGEFVNHTFLKPDKALVLCQN